LKVYQVVKRAHKWHVLIPDCAPGVHPCADKSIMIEWARDAARRVQGEVQVRDLGGQVETIYSYGDGVEASRSA
jgi:hypothetical protein